MLSINNDTQKIKNLYKNGQTIFLQSNVEHEIKITKQIINNICLTRKY